MALCKAIEAHGYLIVANKAEGRQLVQAIKQSGPEVEAAWTAVIRKFQKAGRQEVLAPPHEPGIDRTKSQDELDQGLAEKADMAIVCDSRATSAFGLDDAQLVSYSSGASLEIVRAPAAAVAGRLSEFRETAESGVLQHGQSREYFWTHVIGPIARVSRKISVTDRYLHLNLRRLSDRGKAQQGFLAWLIAKLNQEAQDGCELEVIGYDIREITDNQGATEPAQTLATVCPTIPGRLARVSVLTAQPATYLPHDRHFLSNVGVGVTLHAGFSSFDGESITPLEGIEYSYRHSPPAVQKLQITERRFRDDRLSETATSYEKTNPS